MTFEEGVDSFRIVFGVDGKNTSVANDEERGEFRRVVANAH